MELKALHRLIRFTAISFFSIYALFTTISSTTSTCPDITCTFTAKLDSYFQEFGKHGDKMREQRMMPLSLARRYLSGPGSSPPRCTSKCGRCTPCKPVHVSVPPGTPVMAEYYPEAWRCKCGNKLYMP
ncbi:EPIDERMAL PATTERNING FACTOR-like protein 6 [Pyrus x bretschneideri]|uniref:EPIDERMAL PATTERNING FACTOR-like protein 6 n=1 Tax=Pyrus x bretschneideri TaxID=225117 RepID=UPI0005117FBE|nr:EPIDERMAL PATTERNING FACTOR-like protein 6 [Pyrus x bretschneideri]